MHARHLPFALALRTLALWAACLLPGVPAAAQEKPGQEYEALLARVKKSDPKVDFTRLRLAYTKSPGYDPYGSDPDLRKGIRTALAKKEFAKVVELAGKALRANYLDIETHLAAHRAYKALKDEEKSRNHRYVLDGLIKSILKSGDGKSPKTAFVVISTDEEYVVLGVLGIRRTSQALVGAAGQKYDRLEGVREETNEEVTLYFNVTRQLQWLERQLKGGK
jgi:hypothetical protein